MDFKALLKFLRALNRNNSKEWMDQHRKEYKALRDAFIRWLDFMDLRLSELDPEYYPTPGKKGINRINNNLLFHPNRPVYKDHFGGGLDKAPGKGDFYIQIGIEESLLAGGVWRPSAENLTKIRQAIDYDGEVLKGILDAPSFANMFGGLYEDQPLKRMPKGFSPGHPHEALLKHRTFAVVRPLDEKTVLTPGFEDLVLETYMELLPFRRYLNRALSV
ncbi:DUF2461 domain-containing protein [Robiginitalea aurantiaca]|uniref:DUF2461 domain-containing protein n=1 Tax=Robiginitalea aurantiaca TaxID=3056915 RepID=A0ABT7WCU5_9FLAO|nr:DUF2461 domain-containing protein [Robiginitalea aurantiaca]MDM9630639.1 DUF2461 domain-containing protein [Robiginitalea aurantiaca]